MLCICVANTVMRVCPSRSCILTKRINISSQVVSLSDSHAILFFPYQTLWQYSNGNSPPPIMGASKCRWGRQKSRLSGNSCLYRVLSTIRPPTAVIHTAATDRHKLVTLIAGKRRRLLFTGDDDEVFMTRSLNVTPKTTEQRLIVRSRKS